MKYQVLSIEQMEELKALGLDENAGSMYWHNYNTEQEPRYELSASADFGDIPTYTLQDMLTLLTPFHRQLVMKHDPWEWIESAFDLLKFQLEHSEMKEP